MQGVIAMFKRVQNGPTMPGDLARPEGVEDTASLAVPGYSPQERRGPQPFSTAAFLETTLIERGSFPQAERLETQRCRKNAGSGHQLN